MERALLVVLARDALPWTVLMFSSLIPGWYAASKIANVSCSSISLVVATWPGPTFLLYRLHYPVAGSATWRPQGLPGRADLDESAAAPVETLIRRVVWGFNVSIAASVRGNHSHRGQDRNPTKEEREPTF